LPSVTIGVTPAKPWRSIVAAAIASAAAGARTAERAAASTAAWSERREY
jgi:hypothetical protein